MKKSITFIIIVIMGFGILFAQSVSNTLKIKNIEEIAREQNPDLFSPKDECK